MNNIKPYTKYKPSGIEWLGDIPKHWEVSKIKWLTQVKRGASPRPIDNPIYFDINGEFSWVRIADVSASKRYLSKTKEKLSELGASLSVKRYPNDIFISIAGTVGKPIITKIKCCIHDGFVYFPNLKINAEFLYYLFITGLPYKGLGKMGTQLNLNTETVGTISIPIPNSKEIFKIANFLDYKTAKIDRFIRKQKQLIKLLNEQKAGIINHAVTKGLDQNVKMKDSGIEWLGDIPEHWEVVKLTGVCDLVRGNSSFKKDELLSNGKYVALQYGKTYKVNEVDEKYQFYINDEFYKVSQIVNYGDVIFISTSETIKDLGHSVFYNRSDLGLLGGEQILLKPKNDIVNGKYLCYSSKIFANELKKYATGVKVYRFNINDLKTIYTTVPPIQEQQQIVSHIETETAKLNQTIATIEKEIALVQEYKTALIAEAVTGKIDVRNYVIPEIEETEGYEEIEEELSMVAEDSAEYQTNETE